MIFAFLNHLKKKPRNFNYKPLSYDPELRSFREKVMERMETTESKKINFRKTRALENKKDIQKQVIRFLIVISALLLCAYFIFTSKSLDNFANWLVG